VLFLLQFSKNSLLNHSNDREKIVFKITVQFFDQLKRIMLDFGCATIFGFHNQDIRTVHLNHFVRLDIFGQLLSDNLIPLNKNVADGWIQITFLYQRLRYVGQTTHNTFPKFNQLRVSLPREIIKIKLSRKSKFK